VQYIREAVFIPYLTTDPSIVNAPFQTAESGIKESEVSQDNDQDKADINDDDTDKKNENE
jgi:hypothetical protein